MEDDMKIKNTYSFYFSPTGSTEKVVKGISEHLENVVHTDITLKGVTQEFNSDDLVIIAGPIFANRLINTNVDRLKSLKGNNTPVIALVSYGQVGVGDALLELSDVLTAQGFIVIAAASVITRHSLATNLASQRPTLEDLNEGKDFVNKVIEKLSKVDDIASLEKVAVPGNSPYAKYTNFPIAPYGDSSCDNCLICTKQCPTNAISESSPKKTDKAKCITCMRCISYCPQKARKINPVFNSILRFALPKAADKNASYQYYI